MKKKLQKYLKESISFTVAVSFLISFVFNDFLFARDGRISGDIKNLSEKSIIIDEKYYDDERLIIHILDSHGDSDAQKKIIEIIGFYDKQKPIEKIFVEGAPDGKVSLNLFDGIDIQRKKDILDKMLIENQINAGEYYALYNNRDILFGIEDAKLYNENLKLIRDMLTLNSENEAFFYGVSEKVNKLKKLYVSDSILNIESAINETIKKPYSKIKTFLASDKEIKLDDYESFFKYLSSKEELEKINYKSALKEISSLNKYLSSVLSYKDYSQVNTLLASFSDKAAIAGAYEIIKNKVPQAENKFPEIMAVLKINHLNITVNPYDVYSQKTALKKYIADKYADREEKKILFLSDMIESIKQIYSLNITRKDFSEFLNARKDIRQISAKYLDIAESNTLVNLAENKITDRIYAINLERDKIFFDIVKTAIPLKTANAQSYRQKSDIKDFSHIFIVITGGFHLEFSDFLRNNKISYLNIAPTPADNPDRKKYMDSINIPAKIGAKKISFEKSAFAAPLLNAVNGDSPLKKTIIKNIVTAWIASGIESGLSEEEIQTSIREWLQSQNVNLELLQEMEGLSFLSSDYQETSRQNKRDFPAKDIEIDGSKDENPEKNDGQKQNNEKKSLRERIKDKLGLKIDRLNFPEVAASGTIIETASSYREMTENLKSLKKIKTVELKVQQEENGFFIECRDGFKISLSEVLDAVETFSKKKKRTKIILNLGDNISGDFDKILGATLKRKNDFVIISKNKSFVSSFNSSIYKNVEAVYAITPNRDATETFEEIKELTSLGVYGFHIDKSIFDSVGSYLFSSYNGKYLNLYIQDGKVDEEYGDFIFEGRGKTLLISGEPAVHIEQKKRTLAAYRNITATPFIQLVIGVEFFASFSTIYLNGNGYDLSVLSTMYACCGILSIAGSLISSYLSKIFGKRNVIMVNLLLHCLGDSLLLIAGLSPVFLGFALGVPAMAAAGISVLLIPFLNSSLKAAGQEKKFESVYGKTRSIFWIGLGISSVLGSWLAQTISQPFVIAMSCVIITLLSVYSIFMTGTIDKQEDTKINEEDDELSMLKESKKIFSGIKTVFTTKGLNTTVILNFMVDSVLFAVLALGLQPMLTGSGLSLSLLGIVFFSANLLQSASSKFAQKVSSIINSTFRRTLYFASLAALAGGFIFFNNPVLLIAFYALANFWQGASSVIEPAKVEENLSDDITPYWFSAKSVINSGLVTVVDLALAALFKVFNADIVLFAVTAFVAFASAVLGIVFNDKYKRKKYLKNDFIDTKSVRQILAAA